MREDRPSWQPEGATGSASGGHLTPPQQSDPLTDPLYDTPREEPSRQNASPPADYREERTQVVPRATTPIGREYAPRRPRPTVRRVRRTVKRVDPVSVLKLSLFFYACFLVLWLVFVAFLFFYVDGRGLIDEIQKFGGEQGLVLGWDDLDLNLFFFERWAFLIGLTFAVIGSLFNALLAVLYNVAANLLGGAEFTFVERD